MPAPSLPDDLVAVLAAQGDGEDVRALFQDLLTPAEIQALAERWRIVKLLATGASQRAVADEVGVSITTVSRGARQLKYGHGGFEQAFSVLPALGFADPRRRAS